MTTNRREEHFAAKHAQSLLDAPPPPCTLPQQAYGPQRIEWVKGLFGHSVGVRLAG